MSWQPHLAVAHELWARHLRSGDRALDATCGNGHDTLFLAGLGLREIVALDLQPEALTKAKKRLQGREEKILFLLASHQDLTPLSPPFDLIVYNLGYLPGGDKAVTTRVETTLQSVESALPLLSPHGALSITCYPGHDEGAREEEALLAWARHLPSEMWEVRHHQWLNRLRSPSLLWIAKRVKGSAIHPRGAQGDVGL